MLASYFSCQQYLPFKTDGFEGICEVIDHSLGPIIDDESSMENFWQKAISGKAMNLGPNRFQSPKLITNSYVQHQRMNHNDYVFLVLLYKSEKIDCHFLLTDVNATKMCPIFEEYHFAYNKIFEKFLSIIEDLEDKEKYKFETFLIDQTSDDPRIEQYNIQKVKPSESLLRFSEVSIDDDVETMTMRQVLEKQEKPQLTLVKTKKRKKKVKLNGKKK